MLYEYSLIHVSDTFDIGDGMYALSLVEAHDMTLTLNGATVILSGTYLFCLSDTDTIDGVTGGFTVRTLSFLPYFYNINLNTALIDTPVYAKMREEYGYPDFHLFRSRNEQFNGIVKLTDGEYETVYTLLSSAGQHITEHETDGMWSCRTRSDMISILNIAEAACIGKHADVTNEVLRYIRANPGANLSLTALCERFNTNRTTLSDTIKELTGLSPAQYILSERLGQSRSELLFTGMLLADVAVKYGFSNLNYYIRAFRKKYGVTPLQYRLAGFEKRKREEKNYRLKDGGKGLMTVDEFSDYIAHGLGIAVIRLRREPDKTRFREAFVSHILNNRQYSENDFSYEDELLSCFEDAGQLKDEIVSYLISSGSALRPYQVKLLKRWSSPEQRARLDEAIGTVYENSYRRVYEAADALSDKSLYRLFDASGRLEEKEELRQGNPEIRALNELYSEYHTAVDAVAALDDSLDSVKRLVDRELSMRASTGYVPCAPAYDILFGRLHDANPEIRAYVQSVLPSDYYSKYDMFTVRHLRPSEIRRLDADFFLHEQGADIDAQHPFTSEYLPIQVVKIVEKALFAPDDGHYDLKSKLRLMSLYNFDGYKRRDPLHSPVRFLTILKAAVESNGLLKDYELYWLSSFVLLYRDESIKEYAAELMRKNLLPDVAIESYFVWNYDKKDRELFASRLADTALDSEEQYIYRECFKKGIMRGLPDLPLEMVHRVFRGCTVRPERREFVRALYIGGVNDPHVIEEGLHDADPDIRQYAALMRDGQPYIQTKWMNPATASDYIHFFEKEKDRHAFGIDLDRHMSYDEYRQAVVAPVEEDVFYDLHALSSAARVRLFVEGRITGFLAYEGKQPVGFIDCGRREDFVYLNELAGEGEPGEFVITEPVTFGNTRAADALIRRALQYAEADKCPVIKVYLRKNYTYDNASDKNRELFLQAGFEVRESDDRGNAVLIFKK